MNDTPNRSGHRNDPRVIQRAVALWKGGCYGFQPTYQQALALIDLRIAVQLGNYADDRAVVAYQEGD